MEIWQMGQEKNFCCQSGTTRVNTKCTQYKYLGEVKRADVENKVKIISISGDEIKRQKKIYKNLFVSYFLQKPFSRNELLTALLELENS